ncbi:MAG: hypothetical protein JNM31_06760 [Flavobacteriales bacterium]|nr:hypothetical protein [Flavobacteriales bacterium]
MNKTLLNTLLPAILLLGMADGIPTDEPSENKAFKRMMEQQVEPYRLESPDERASVMHYRYRKNG